MTLNPFAARKNSHGWVLPVSLLMMAIGYMISVAFLSQKKNSEILSGLPASIRQPILTGELDVASEYAKSKEEITKLRSEKGRLENSLAKNKNASEDINKSLQESKLVAGLTEVEGPGVLITLSDSRKSLKDTLEPLGMIVHDTDVIRVINELWNAGAEAISVNNLRIGPTSNIFCAGVIIHVDGIKVASPIELRAVGDPKLLYGAVNTPGTILDELRAVDASMVRVDPVKKMHLPAWSGSTTFKYAKVPEDKK